MSIFKTIKTAILGTINHLFYHRKIFNTPPTFQIKDNIFIFSTSKSSYNPVVIHFSGKNYEWTQTNIQKINREYDFNIENSDLITVIQLNNYKNYSLKQNPGEHLLKKHKITYVASGKEITRAFWRNSIKINLMHTTLKNIKAKNPKKKYFLFFDSADAILLRTPKQLIKALQEYKCDILFGLDKDIYNGLKFYKNLISPPEYLSQYANDNFRFLNSGIIFGKIDTMLSILDDIVTSNTYESKNRNKSDQYYFHKIRFKYKDKINIDYKKKYLLNVFPYKSIFQPYQ